MTVHIKGMHEDTVVDARFETPVSIKLDDFDDKSTVLDESVCIMIKHMRKNELAHFWVEPQYWGAEGGALPGVPRDAVLRYELDLLTAQFVCLWGGEGGGEERGGGEREREREKERERERKRERESKKRRARKRNRTQTPHSTAFTDRMTVSMCCRRRASRSSAVET